MVIKRPKIRKLKNMAIRGLVVMVAWGALWYQLRHHDNLSALPGQLAERLGDPGATGFLGLVFFLMLINWSLEALKWRYLIRKSEKISFFRSLKAIFTGISAGTFTPNRLGEFLGRSFVLDKTHPWKVFFMTLIGSYSQLLATILFGTFGLFFFTWHYSVLSTGFTYLDRIIIFFGLATVALLMLLYFNIDVLDKMFGKRLRRRRPGFATWFRVISAYNASELLVVLLFSISRYLTFSIQYLLLLKLFGLSVPTVHALAIIAVVYLVMTIIPSIAWSEIGIRGSASLYFFGFYFTAIGSTQDPSLEILSTTTALWLVNLVLPALLGTLFVYHLRVFRNPKNGN